MYSYSSYAPLTYHTLPYYSYYRTLPSTLYLPSAVPLRYYSRSTPVRVITSPLRDYTPPRILSVSVRPSVIHRELMRIEHKTRPRYGYDPTDEFLNSVHAKVSVFSKPINVMQETEIAHQNWRQYLRLGIRGRHQTDPYWNVSSLEPLSYTNPTWSPCCIMRSIFTLRLVRYHGSRILGTHPWCSTFREGRYLHFVKICWTSSKNHW